MMKSQGNTKGKMKFTRCKNTTRKMPIRSATNVITKNVSLSSKGLSKTDSRCENASSNMVLKPCSVVLEKLKDCSLAYSSTKRIEQKYGFPLNSIILKPCSVVLEKLNDLNLSNACVMSKKKHVSLLNSVVLKSSSVVLKKSNVCGLSDKSIRTKYASLQNLVKKPEYEKKRCHKIVDNKKDAKDIMKNKTYNSCSPERGIGLRRQKRINYADLASGRLSVKDTVPHVPIYKTKLPECRVESKDVYEFVETKRIENKHRKTSVYEPNVKELRKLLGKCAKKNNVEMKIPVTKKGTRQNKRAINTVDKSIKNVIVTKHVPEKIKKPINVNIEIVKSVKLKKKLNKNNTHRVQNTIQSESSFNCVTTEKNKKVVESNKLDIDKLQNVYCYEDRNFGLSIQSKEGNPKVNILGHITEEKVVESKKLGDDKQQNVYCGRDKNSGFSTRNEEGSTKINILDHISEENQKVVESKKLGDEKEQNVYCDNDKNFRLSTQIKEVSPKINILGHITEESKKVVDSEKMDYCKRQSECCDSDIDFDIPTQSKEINPKITTLDQITESLDKEIAESEKLNDEQLQDEYSSDEDVDFGFSTQEKEASPKINILHQIIVTPDKEVVIQNKVTPWRAEFPMLRYNPHFLQLKKSSLPSANQEMVLNSVLVEKCSSPFHSTQEKFPSNQLIQTDLLNFINCSPVRTNDTFAINNSLFDAENFSPIKLNKSPRKADILTPKDMNIMLNPKYFGRKIDFQSTPVSGNLKRVTISDKHKNGSVVNSHNTFESQIKNIMQSTNNIDEDKENAGLNKKDNFEAGKVNVMYHNENNFETDKENLVPDITNSLKEKEDTNSITYNFEAEKEHTICDNINNLEGEKENTVPDKTENIEDKEHHVVHEKTDIHATDKDNGVHNERDNFEKSTFFGFDDSNDVVENNNICNKSKCPTRLTYKSVKQILKDQHRKIADESFSPGDECLIQDEYENEETEPDNSFKPKLFEDLESNFSKDSFRSYKPKSRKRHRFLSYASDEEDHVELQRKKKKDLRTPAEEKEVEKWAQAFNAMCEDVENFPLNID